MISYGKRWAALLLALLLVLSMAACGGKAGEPGKADPKTPAEDPVDPQPGGQDPVDPQPTQPEYEKSDLLTSYYRLPTARILMDTPGNYHETEQNGFTRLYSVYDSRYVAITYDPEETTASAKEALDLVWENYKQGIWYYNRIKELNITSESTETVNGVEVYKFVGTSTCYLDYYGDKDLTEDVFIIGYSFVMDNTACSVIGTVESEAQGPEEIAEVTAIVEAMIKTLRDPGK